MAQFDLHDDSVVVVIGSGAGGGTLSHELAQKGIKVVCFEAGNHHEQKARLVCLAGNAIETPRLLLLSASSLFPEGLANSSGHVGKNYMSHLTGAAYAIMPGEVYLHRGTQQAGIVQDEQYHKPERGFAAGYELETLPALGLPGFPSYAKPGGWGREYARDIEAYRNAAGLWIVGEDMPQEQNRVTLDPHVKDHYGLPVAHVHRVDHPNDTAMRQHAWQRATALYEAAGARKVYTRGPFPSTHNLGTCRQSTKPRDGVCNTYGQTHDIKNLFISDGSQFTTCAAENPTLTIVALAIWQAEYLADEMRKRNI